MPVQTWITADETLNTGSITYEISRNSGTTFTTCTKDSLTDITSQPSGNNLVLRVTITGEAELNAVAWGCM